MNSLSKFVLSLGTVAVLGTSCAGNKWTKVDPFGFNDDVDESDPRLLYDSRFVKLKNDRGKVSFVLGIGSAQVKYIFNVPIDAREIHLEDFEGEYRLVFETKTAGFSENYFSTFLPTGLTASK